MLKDTAKFEPKIVAFCCNWCSYAGADGAGTARKNYPANVKIIKVPCSCRVNPMFILRAFQRGADGVILCGCHPGDCHYSTGNYYTRRRMALLMSMLNFMGVAENRFRVEWVSAAEGAKFADVMNDFVAQITALGENVKLRDLRCKKQQNLCKLKQLSFQKAAKQKKFLLGVQVNSFMIMLLLLLKAQKLAKKLFTTSFALLIWQNT